MTTQEILDPQRLSETTFGQTQLKDMHRTRRAVRAATHMAEDSAASRPSQAQTVLAIEPDSREVLGCAYQHPFIRIPAPKGETRAQRRKRKKETDVWHHCAQHSGASPASSRWVHVADRGADSFEFLHVCRSLDTHFVVRATQDRRVQTPEGPLGSL